MTVLKIRSAGESFLKGDHSSTMNNSNTAAELMLKDKLDIPTTITKINTSNILDLLISEKIGPPPVIFSRSKKAYLAL